MSSHRPISRVLPVSLALLTLASCGDHGDPVVPTNEPPTAILSVNPSEGTAPLRVEITLSCSDPDGSVAEHRLDLDGDGAFDRTGGAIAVFVTYVRSVTVRGQCVDDEGAESPVRSRDVGVSLEPTDGPGPLLPRGWTLPVSETVRFRVDRADGVAGGSLVWFVDGIVGGHNRVGTIDANGLYTAPSSPPERGPVEVGVMLEGAQEALGYAPVQVVGSLGEVRLGDTFTRWSPRVVTPDSEDSLELELAFLQGYPRTVELDLGGLGDIRELQPVRSGTYRLRLAPDDVLLGHREGDLHTFVGFLRASGENEPEGRLNVFMNVLDPTVPDVGVRSHAEDVQSGRHVVNVRYDSLFLAGRIPSEVTERFYDFFPDDFDFLAIVEQVDSPNNRTSRVVRTDEGGLGRSPFDRSADFGSSGRLRGLIDYPISTFFDLAEPGSLHEIGHQWMVSVDVEDLEIRSGGHWARGSAAHGIMGTSGASGQGVSFPFEVVPTGGDEYELRCTDHPTEFNDLELYLMGLLPADSVGPHVVFDDQTIDLSCGAKGAATRFTIGDVVAANDPREPAHPAAPTDFRIGTIVLSRGGLLTPEELSFFDHMAARGAAEDELFFSSGFLAGTAKPFALATGGRGTLTTTIR